MKKLLSISVVLLGLMFCFSSCDNSSTPSSSSLNGTKWIALQGDETYYLSVTSDTQLVLEYSYKGSSTEIFGVGTYSMSSQTELAGTMTTDDYGSFLYTASVNGNTMIVNCSKVGTFTFTKVK